MSGTLLVLLLLLSIDVVVVVVCCWCSTIKIQVVEIFEKTFVHRNSVYHYVGARRVRVTCRTTTRLTEAVLVDVIWLKGRYKNTFNIKYKWLLKIIVRILENRQSENQTTLNFDIWTWNFTHELLRRRYKKANRCKHTHYFDRVRINDGLNVFLH